MTLQAIVLGAVTALTLEALVLLLRRFARQLQPGILFDAVALLAGLAVTLTRLPVRPIALEVTFGLLALATALVLYELVDAGILRRPWDSARGPIWPRLARDVARVLLVAVVALFVANRVFGVALSALLVSSTVLSAVLGLALQDVLGQVFAGMALQIERPFAIGDWLTIDAKLAKVVEMGWRSVRLRTNDGVDIYQPNSVMSGALLENHGSGRQAVAFQFEVGVDYAVPPARVREALLTAARETPGVADQPPCEVFLVRFGDSSMVYRLRVWTHEVARFNPLMDALNGRIWYALRRAGHGIPFPIRTVQMHDADADRTRSREGEIERAQELLARVEIFAGLPASALRQLAESARVEAYDGGERLVRENEQGDSLFVIERGSVVVTKSGAALDTGSIEMARFGPGDFFGEMSLLTGEPRSATVTAQGGCEVLVLQKTALQPLMAEDPAIAETLSLALAVRRAGAAATLQERQGRGRGETGAVQESLLRRIRTFFTLGD